MGLIEYIYCHASSVVIKADAIPIANIHATILSILIGFISGYYFYINSKIYELEEDAIDTASEINRTERSSSWYKLLHASHFFLEKWPKEIEQGKVSLVYFLRQLFAHPSDEYFDVIPIPTPLKTYKDLGLNRTEIRLCLMTSILWQKPFAKVMIEDKPGQSRYDYRIFKDKYDIENWLKDANQLFPLVDELRIRGIDSFSESFDWGVEIDLQKRFHNIKEPMSLSTKEELMKLPKEFTKELLDLWDISRIVGNKLSRINFLKRSSPPIFIFKTLIIFSLIIFITSVIAPLYSDSIRSLYLVELPSVFYMALVAYFIYKILY